MNNKICIITGSTLGASEYVGEHISEVLTKQGYESRLEHGPDLKQIIDEKCWLVITSTHGAGELPDNIKPLFDELEAHPEYLNDLRFAVIGLGNSDYDTFCYAVNHVEQILTNKKASKICNSLKIDMINVIDPEEYSVKWLPNFTSQI